MLTQMRRKQKGFTLLELLIVVIIVGILAAVAMPQFARMTRRSRAAEAYDLIGAILTAEWAYRQEKQIFTGAYADLLVDLPGEGPNEYFNYGAPVIAGTGEVSVVATGDAGSPTANMTVTGTLNTDGSRDIQITNP